MFYTSVNTKTTLTFNILAIAAAIAFLFASGYILPNQQALAANIGNVGHLYLGGLLGYPYFGGYSGYGGYPYITGYGGYPYYYHHHHPTTEQTRPPDRSF
jgi:hypothetical protein